MPLSWFRVPRDTSDKLKECRGSDKSDSKFVECVTRIAGTNGRVVAFRHVGHGRFSLVHIDWRDIRGKAAIERDLEATEVPDPDSEGGDGPAAGPPG